MRDMPLYRRMSVECETCGAVRIVSAFVIDDVQYVVVTCVDCDSPETGD